MKSLKVMPEHSLLKDEFLGSPIPIYLPRDCKNRVVFFGNFLFDCDKESYYIKLSSYLRQASIL